MTIENLTDDIHREIGSPNSLSKIVITYFLRANVGYLNNLIFTGYSIDGTDGTIDPDLSEEAAVILKKIWMIHYWTTKINECIGAGGYDIVTEVGENGALVRMVSRNELSKSYFQMRKSEQEELDKLVSGYKMLNSIPVAVHGEDDQEGDYTSNDLEVRQGT